jgi:hypothetical protein
MFTLEISILVELQFQRRSGSQCQPLKEDGEMGVCPKSIKFVELK